MSKRYPSDLTDAQWAKVKGIFQPTRKSGRQRTHSAREMLNAILYVMKEGCSWRSLPKEFPHWNTVFIQRDAGLRIVLCSAP